MSSRCLLSASVCGLLLSLGSSAFAADVQECVDAYGEGQVLERDGKLIAARDKFLFCTSDECPEVVRTQCTELLEELELKLPTVVLGARTTQGEDETDVEVYEDGQVFTEVLDGRALAINPGKHVLRFVTRDGREAEHTVVIKEGERARSIIVDLPSPGEPPKAEPAARTGGTPPADTPPPSGGGWSKRHTAYVLWGVGAAALGGFIGFGIAGNSEADSLRNDGCGTTRACTEEEVGNVRTLYAAADIMLGASIVAGLTGGFFFLTDSGPEPQPAAGPASAAMGPAAAGASQTATVRRFMIGWRGRF